MKVYKNEIPFVLHVRHIWSFFFWLAVEEYKLLSSVLRSFLQIHFTFPILSTNICLSILIAETKVCKFLSFKKPNFMKLGFVVSEVL